MTGDVTTAVESAPRGSYQRDLVNRRETWSGSSLRGAARQYGGVYLRSRQSLLRRIQTRLPDG